MARLGKYALCAVSLWLITGCGIAAVQPGGGGNNDHNNTAPSQPKTVQKERGGAPNPASSSALPKINHIVVVIEENRSYDQIIGNPSASYINVLAKKGALFTESHGVEHPSQPNYIQLFSGTNQGITSDACPHRLTAPNLATALTAKGLTFGGYSEDLPNVGFLGCFWHQYARKHAPWTNFTNVPSRMQMPFSQFPNDEQQLPTVSFVIPNLNHDMHDGTVGQADAWLRQKLDSYVRWAMSHNSLLIVTWDEDDFSPVNRIPTLMVGPMVRPGVYGQWINHYNVLRTIEDIYGISHLGDTASVASITNIWK